MIRSKGLLASGFILLVSLGLLIWTISPGKPHQVKLVQPPVSFMSFTIARRPIWIDLPASLRRGEVEIIRLQIGAFTVEKAPSVLAEARLELPGVEIQPGEVIETAMRPGQPVTFEWEVKAANTTNLQGTIWVHLSHEGERIAVLAYPLVFSERRLLGLSVPIVRWISLISGVIGMIGLYQFIIHKNQAKD